MSFPGRGTQALRMPPKTSQGSQPSQLTEAPTFYPSCDEFREPLVYIAKIRPQAEEFGACKIVPPPGWKPRFALDRKALRFKTRVQSVHELQERSNAEEEFEQQYHDWLRVVKRTWKGSPMLNGREVDLYKLQKVVRRRGGYQKISESKSWKEVCRILQIRDKGGNAAYMVRQLYQKYLLPFEEHRAKRESVVPVSTAVEGSMTTFDRIVAERKGKEDIEVLGAVAVLMDAPSGHAQKRLKLDTNEGGRVKDLMRVPDNIYTMVCELCKGGHREEKIILCDKCDRGCHMFCLQPPLQQVPEGEWICPLCVAEDSESKAFRAGKEYTLDQFERLAKDFKNDWFGGAAAAEKATIEDIEQAFWDVVEAGEEPTEVMYGADLDTSVMGSAFHVRGDRSSTPLDHVDRVYAESPWNLNNLPSLEDSLLKHLEDSIAGVTLPWMYMGMMFSSFCWHIEDHMFYSMNYLHWGEAKRWYSVPASAADAFEGAFRSALPELFEKQPDVLFHLVTMLSPRILQAANVPVYGISQMPGEFVVTFPCSYHGGFNTGLNCAEAVNFAPSDWLRFGEASVTRFRTFRKQPILCHSWLLLKVAADDPEGELAFWAEKELRRIFAEEREWRFRLQRTGCYKARRVDQPVGLHAGAKDDAECAICRCYLHLSAVECKCCPKRYVCMQHADSLCDCPASSWRLAYRHSLGELSNILNSLQSRVPAGMRDASQEKAKGEHARPVKLEEIEASPGTTQGRNATAKSPRPVNAQTNQMDVERPLASCQETSAELLNAKSAGPGVPCREPSGNEAPAEPAEAARMKAGGKDSSGVQDAPAPLPPLIPRKRTRKAYRPPRTELKRKRSEELVEKEDAAPAPRITRAAIKAEEEAQDTIEVLSALAGLSGLEGFEHKAGSHTPSARSSPAPHAPAEPDEEILKPDLHTGARSSSLPAGVLNKHQKYGTAALTDCFDVNRAADDLREMHKAWLERGYEIFRRGGARASDVEALLQQSHQLMWGEDAVQVGVPELVARLKDAQSWAQKISGFLKQKGELEEVEAALSTAPIAVPGLHRLVEGVRAGHAWVAKVETSGLRVQMAELKALEGLVSEGQRLPVALPHLKEFKERLQNARSVLESIRMVLPGYVPVVQAKPPVPVDKTRARRKRPPTSLEEDSKAEASSIIQQPAAEAIPQKVQEITLEWLRSLQAQAKALKVNFPELADLQQMIAGVEAFQAKIAETLQVKPSLEALGELVAAYEKLRVIIPEMFAVHKLMNSARAWLNRARGLTQVRTPLKKMRDTLHAGLRLGTTLPEVEQLRIDIRRREWEESAKRVLNNRQTIAGMVDSLAEAAVVGAADTELATGIRSRLDMARAWNSQAEDFFAAPGKASLSALEGLVADGNALGIRLDQLQQATLALEAASEWSARAEAVDSSNAETPFEERPSIDQVEDLLLRYQQLVVALPQAEGLTIKRDEAIQWAQAAELLLAKPLSEDLLEEYKSTAVQGWTIGVQLDGLVSLQDCLAALEWEHNVMRIGIDAISQCPAESPQASRRLDLDQDGAEPSLTQGQGEAKPLPAEDPMEATLYGLGNGSESPHICPGQTVVTAALKKIVEPTPLHSAPLAPDLHGGASQRKGDALQPDDPQSSIGEDADKASAGAPGQKARISVEAAQQLLAEGQLLPVKPALLSGLQQNLDLVAAWETRLSELGQHQRVGGIPPKELIPLIEEARDMTLQPDSLPALEDALTKASTWQARAEKLLKNETKPHFAEVLAIAVSGREMLVQAEGSSRVEAVVAAAEQWQEDLRQVVALKKERQRLSRCMRAMGGTLDLALQQLERHVQDEAMQPMPEDEFGISEPGSYEDDERDLYCVCQQPYSTETAMISCDSCEEWFHCRCIGMAPTTARSVKKYICPICLAVRGTPKELELTLMRTQKTRRAAPEKLEQVLQRAETLPCIVEEAEALKGVLEKYRIWNTATEALLNGHVHGKVSLPTSLVGVSGSQRRPERTDELPEEAPESQQMQTQASLLNDVRSTAALQEQQGDPEGPLSSTKQQQHVKDEGALLSGAGGWASLATDTKGSGSMDSSDARGRGTPPHPANSLAGQQDNPEAFGERETKRERNGELPGKLETANLATQPDLGGGSQNALGKRLFVDGKEIVTRPSLTLRTLTQLLKSTLSVELDVGTLQDRLLEAVRLHRWRAKASVALRANTKYSVDALCKLAREGEAAGVDPGSDRWAAALFERATKFRLWLDQVDDVVEKLAEDNLKKIDITVLVKRGDLLIKEARTFEIPSLPRGFEKDLARLEEACKLYCLCQLPYNEERPMLGCDYCQDWFHYDCVGLRAPSDDEDDADVAPEDYRCPKCCSKAGKPYPLQHKLPAKSLEALGLEVPKPLEAIARSMANNLVHHANPLTMEHPHPPAKASAASEQRLAMPFEGAHTGDGGPYQGPELANHGGASRLHELLSPLQAQALGEAQQAMLIGGMQPQPPPNSWLLNILAAQQSLHPNMLQMLPNAFAQQAYQASNNYSQGHQSATLPNTNSILTQQLQQSHNAGASAGDASSLL